MDGIRQNVYMLPHACGHFMHLEGPHWPGLGSCFSLVAHRAAFAFCIVGVSVFKFILRGDYRKFGKTTKLWRLERRTIESSNPHRQMTRARVARPSSRACSSPSTPGILVHGEPVCLGSQRVQVPHEDGFWGVRGLSTSLDNTKAPVLGVGHQKPWVGFRARGSDALKTRVRIASRARLLMLFIVAQTAPLFLQAKLQQASGLFGSGLFGRPEVACGFSTSLFSGDIFSGNLETWRWLLVAAVIVFVWLAIHSCGFMASSE